MPACAYARHRSVSELSISSATKAQSNTIEQLVTPWDVRGQVIDGVEVGIDYGKLMNQFGCQPISEGLVCRLEKQTGKPAHPLLRRGAFYCHR